MAILIKGQDFADGEQITATKLDNLVDNATFASGAVDNTSTALDSSSPQKIIVKDSGITTSKLADSSSKTTGVTFAKMQHISTAQVLGRVSASEGDVEEVGVVIGGSGDAGLLFDNDDMLDNSDTAGGSATRGATQQSIKAYVDGGGGFTPASYAGGESVTLPNGLIMKFGTVTTSSNSNTAVNFSVGFTAAISAQVSLLDDTNNDRAPIKIASLDANTLSIRNSMNASFDVHWLAFGR